MKLRKAANAITLSVGLVAEAQAQDVSIRATNVIMYQCGAVYQAGLEANGVISTIEHGIKNQCDYVLAHFPDGSMTLKLDPKKFACEGDDKFDQRCTYQLPDSLPAAVKNVLEVKYVTLDYQPNHPRIQVGQTVSTVRSGSYDIRFGGYQLSTYKIKAIDSSEIILEPNYQFDGVQTGDLCKGFSGASLVLTDQGRVIKNQDGAAISIGQLRGGKDGYYFNQDGVLCARSIRVAR